MVQCFFNCLDHSDNQKVASVAYKVHLRELSRHILIESCVECKTCNVAAVFDRQQDSETLHVTIFIKRQVFHVKDPMG